MPNTDAIERKIRDTDALTVNTINQYIQHARVFASETNKVRRWTHDDVVAYFERLKKKGRSTVTITQHYWILVSLFKILGEPSFGVSIKELKLDRQPRKLQSVLDVSAIETMIKYVRSEGEPEQKLMLAMATVYGLRREELSRLDPELHLIPEFGVTSSFTDSTAIIETAKHGLPREHSLAPEIMPYIAEGLRDGRYPIPITTLSLMYHRIHRRSGLPEAPGRDGWHSIRRALDTDLVDAGVPDRMIENFMRWAAGAKSGMVGRYYTPRGGFGIDKRVFEMHPYLGFWG